jgi:hypothetical protein
MAALSLAALAGLPRGAAPGDPPDPQGRRHAPGDHAAPAQLADLNVTIEEGLSISGVQLSKTLGAGAALIDRFTASSARLVDLELRSELAAGGDGVDEHHLRRHRRSSTSVGLPGTAGTSHRHPGAFTALQGGLFRPLMACSTVLLATSSLALFARIRIPDLPVEWTTEARRDRPAGSGPPALRRRHRHRRGFGITLDARRHDGPAGGPARQEHPRRADHPAPRPDSGVPSTGSTSATCGSPTAAAAGGQPGDCLLHTTVRETCGTRADAGRGARGGPGRQI